MRTPAISLNRQVFRGLLVLNTIIQMLARLSHKTVHHSSSIQQLSDMPALIRTYMWQSRVEIEHYSVANFNHIVAFKLL